jgi:hypothetical protein
MVTYKHQRSTRASGRGQAAKVLGFLLSILMVVLCTPRVSQAAPKIPADLRKAIDDAKAFVEKARGHTFKREPPIEVLESKAFIKKFRAAQLSDKDYEKNRRELSALILALGLVAPDADPLKLFDALLDGGVAGYYDTKKNVLVVRGGKVTPEVKVILVHELTHALDAQYTNLDREELSKRDDDSAEAFGFVVEGIARTVENKYRATLSAAETAAVAAEESANGSSPALFSLIANPKYTRAVPFLITSLLSPYEIGKEFIADVIADGGTEGVDALYKRAPASTEQAIKLSAYKANEPAKKVALPPLPADAKLIDKGNVGQSSLNAILSNAGSLSSMRVNAAADGWGGDAYILYQQGKKFCITMDFVMDTDKDRVELEKALKSSSAGRPLEKVTAMSGGLTRYESCSQ